jgi:hypothetical protein
LLRALDDSAAIHDALSKDMMCPLDAGLAAARLGIFTPARTQPLGFLGELSAFIFWTVVLTTHAEHLIGLLLADLVAARRLGIGAITRMVLGDAEGLVLADFHAVASVETALERGFPLELPVLVTYRRQYLVSEESRDERALYVALIATAGKSDPQA